MAKNIEELINFNNKYVQKKQLPISQRIKEIGKEEVELTSIFEKELKEEQDKTVSFEENLKKETNIDVPVKQVEEDQIKLNISNIKAKKEEIKTEIEQFQAQKQQIDKTVKAEVFNKTETDKTIKANVFNKTETDKTVKAEKFSKSGTDKTVTTPIIIKYGLDKTVKDSLIDNGFGAKVSAENFSKISGKQGTIPEKAYVEFMSGEKDIYGNYVNLYDFAKASGLQQNLPNNFNKTVTTSHSRKTAGSSVYYFEGVPSDTIVLNNPELYSGISRFYQVTRRDLGFIRTPNRSSQYIIPRSTEGGGNTTVGLDGNYLISDPRRLFDQTQWNGKRSTNFASFPGSIPGSPKTSGITRTQGDGGDTNVYIDINNTVRTTEFQEAAVGETITTERTLDLSVTPKKSGDANNDSAINKIDIDNRRTQQAEDDQPARTVDYSVSQRILGTDEGLPEEKTINILNETTSADGTTTVNTTVTPKPLGTDEAATNKINVNNTAKIDETMVDLTNSPKTMGVQDPAPSNTINVPNETTSADGTTTVNTTVTPRPLGTDEAATNKIEVPKTTKDQNNNVINTEETPKQSGIPTEGINEQTSVSFNIQNSTEINNNVVTKAGSNFNKTAGNQQNLQESEKINVPNDENKTEKNADGTTKKAGNDFEKTTGGDQQATNKINIPEINNDTILDVVSQTEQLSLKNSKLKLTSGIDSALQEKINGILSGLYDNLKAARPGEIGFLYIKPITTSANYLPFKIPFEFNPKITESGLSAKYNAVSFLSRIGDIQNFVGVSPLTITISTEYKVLTESESSNNNDPDYWMNFYTQSYIDKIEMAYRSLILPDFILTNSQTTYVRPPAIKIIFGDEKKLNLQESNSNLDYNKGQFEFSYPAYPGNVSALYESNKLIQSQNTNPLRFHKLFVATSLTINKDITIESISSTNGINRFNGFTVDLTLVEVTENYMDLLPDYKVYYEFFKNSSMPRRG